MPTKSRVVLDIDITLGRGDSRLFEPHIVSDVSRGEKRQSAAVRELKGGPAF